MQQGMPSAIERELTRRGFVAGAGGGVFALASLGGVIEMLRQASEAAAQTGLAPDDPAVKATISAFADTIVPGPAGGAHTAPGAVEAGAVEEAYDPFYGAVGTYPVIHRDLQLTTPLVIGRPASFDLQLPYPDREKVVLNRILSPGSGGGNAEWVLYQGLAILIYTAYYGTARSDAGPRFLRFPPASDGYWPKHSYRRRFRRMTKDGNPR